MISITPLPVAIPLIVATVLAGGGPWLRRPWIDALAIITAAVVTILCALLMSEATTSPLVYWFGGWQPRNGIALGIAFTVDWIGAGAAALVAALVTVSLIFAWRYFSAIRSLFHALMLVFLAGMVGFCLSGDLFNLFVFFELMSVAAYTLTAYKADEPSALAGGINFTITNSVGAFLILMGMGLIYGRTGALNLAQISRAVADTPVDGLLVVAFVFIVSGYLVKAAIMPFHFWLADAHAVAPTPVCVIFSGIMVELGLYGVARIYWVVFSDPFEPHMAAMRNILISIGVLTAILGAVVCFPQRHLKRLLAFSTISHSGMLLIGMALLTPGGLAGVAIYTLGHALVKSALFICAGILLHRHATVDELELCGRGGKMFWTGAAFLIGGLALAGVPPFETFRGKGMMEASAGELGYSWLTIVFVFASAVTGGAVIRAFGRVFLGWGPQQTHIAEAPTEAVHRETEEDFHRTPISMVVSAIFLVGLAAVFGMDTNLPRQASLAAVQFNQTTIYTTAVLDGNAQIAPVADPPEHPVEFAPGIISGLGAITLALSELLQESFPAAVKRAFRRVANPAVVAINAVHSGRIGDYIVWLMLGVGALGGIMALLVR